MEANPKRRHRFPEFEKRFKELQVRMGFEGKDEEFGKIIGVTRQTVSKYRNGVRVPDAVILNQIACKAGVSVDWLTGNAPLENPFRKRGKWTQDWIAEKLGIYVCSECSQPLGMVNEFMNHTTVNFCPNCGAEMRGEE